MKERKRVQLDLDLGNTQVRGIAKIGEFGVNQKDKLLIAPNIFSTVKRGVERYIGSREYDASNSTLIKLDSNRKYTERVQDHYLTAGKLQQFEFGLSTLPKINKSLKVDLLQSYASIFSMVVKALDWLVEDRLVDAKTIEEAANEVYFELAILLPPTQKDATVDLFTERLVGNHHISSIFPMGELDIVVDSVSFQQEGLAAFFTLQTTRDLQPRLDLAMRLKDSVALGIDMGGSTFDLIVINKRSTVENSRHTITLGGSTVVSKLNTALQKITPKDLSEVTVMNVLLTGKFDDGRVVHDMTETINVIKDEVAESIVSSIGKYLDGATFDISDVSLIVPIGGNMLEAEDKSIDSLGKLVLDGLVDLLPRAEVLKVSDYDFTDFTDVYGTRVPLERLLNIYGLSTITNIRSRRA